MASSRDLYPNLFYLRYSLVVKDSLEGKVDFLTNDTRYCKEKVDIPLGKPVINELGR